MFWIPLKKISTLLGIRKDEEKPGSSGINSFSPFEWALLIPRGLDQVMLAVGILNFYVHRQKEFWCRSSQGSCILIQSSRTTLNSQPQHPLSVQSLRAAGSVQDSLSCFSSLKAFNYLFFLLLWGCQKNMHISEAVCFCCISSKRKQILFLLNLIFSFLLMDRKKLSEADNKHKKSTNSLYWPWSKPASMPNLALLPVIHHDYPSPSQLPTHIQQAFSRAESLHHNRHHSKSICFPYLETKVL